MSLPGAAGYFDRCKFYFVSLLGAAGKEIGDVVDYQYQYDHDRASSVCKPRKAYSRIITDAVCDSDGTNDSC